MATSMLGPYKYLAQTSTAAHYSTGFGTATVGLAEVEFYGIPLSEDLLSAPVEQWIGLALLYILVVSVRPSLPGQWPVRVAMGVGIATLCAWLLPDVTLIPILSAIVHTRTSYPYLIVTTHCITVHATYRRKHGPATNRLQALLMSFVFYGFGGTITSDLLMGLPITAVAHSRGVPFHVLAWILIWYSPYDWVYQAVKDPGSIMHYFLLFGDAIDSVVTPFGRIGRAARELRNKTTAPIVGGMLAGLGGAILRYISGEEYRHQSEAFWKALEQKFWTTLGYCLLWWFLVVYCCDYGVMENVEWNHCASYNGSDLGRVIVVTAHVIWVGLCEVGWVSSHPFAWLAERVVGNGGVAKWIKILRLGPPPATTTETIMGNPMTPDKKRV